MNGLSLFSGIGGIDLGLKWAIPELRTVCHVERNPYCAGVLIKLMEQGALDPAPIWDDVCTFYGKPWRGRIDIISGGFPCQDISVAGKAKGIIEGETRSGLWHEYARIIDEVRPRFVLVENVAALLIRGIDIVLGSLSALGYDAQWRIISAQEVGAPHLRERVFIVAYNNGERRDDRWDHRERRSISDAPDNNCQRESKQERSIGDERGRPRDGTPQASHAPDDNSKRTQGRSQKEFQGSGAFRTFENVRRIEDIFERSDIPQPLIRGGRDGLSYRVDRIKALGNAVVPQCAANAAREMILPFL